MPVYLPGPYYYRGYAYLDAVVVADEPIVFLRVYFRAKLRAKRILGLSEAYVLDGEN